MSGGIGLTVARSAHAARQQVMLDALNNLKGQNFDLLASGASVAMTTQRLYLMTVPLLAGDVVNTIAVNVAVAASSVTTFKVGVYTLAGARQAVSANTATATNARGNSYIDLTSPYTASADGCVLFAVLADGSGLANLAASGNTGVGRNIGYIGTTILHAIMAGQTDLPATATLDTTTSGSAMWWVGWK